MSTVQSELMMIPLTSFVLSRTPMQIERRKERTKEQIAELADTIKRVGLIHPIVARPTDKDGTLEIVAGEGRYLAAKLAGLAHIQTNIRDLTDEQAEEVQLIENLQRKDLHELVEALGYEQLLKRKHTVDEIAAKVGKSARTIYTRLQLLKLDPASQEALRRGELTASTAMLIARIPVAALQRKALGEITKPKHGWDQGPMSYRAALEHIQDHYMLRLEDAPFSTGDEQLVAKAGSCAKCPKRTGNNRDLFGDIKGADVCTDPPCFKSKCEAHAAALLAAATESGQKVIVGSDAKKAVNWERDDFDDDVQVSGQYVKPTDRCYDDPKNRTYQQLVGKDVKPALLKTPKGKVIEVFERGTIAKALRDSGVTGAKSSDDRYAAQRSAQDKKHKRELAYRRQLYTAILAKVPAKLERKDLDAVALAFFADIWHDTRVKIVAAWGWAEKGSKDTAEEIVERQLPKLTDADLARFLFGLTIAKDLNVSGYSNEKPKELLAAAARFKVNAEAIRKALADEERAKAKPAKASKTKPAAKKKAPRKAK